MRVPSDPFVWQCCTMYHRLRAGYRQKAEEGPFRAQSGMPYPRRALVNPPQVELVETHPDRARFERSVAGRCQLDNSRGVGCFQLIWTRKGMCSA
jgi:hypothetical protein